MKPLILLSILVLAISCGKDNKSGANPNITNLSPIVTNENSLKDSFIINSRNTIRDYGADMNLYFNENITSRVSSRLRAENIYLTETTIYSSKTRTPTASVSDHSLITLYVGQQYPELNWYNYLTQNHPQLQRLIMHVLIEFSGIQDTNYRHTDRILSQRIR